MIKKLRMNENSSDFDYRLLSRLESDCKYFLGGGYGAEKHLWAKSVEDQIAKMKEIYNSLDVKPEWLTMQDIEHYEKEMKKVKYGKSESIRRKYFKEQRADIEVENPGILEVPEGKNVEDLPIKHFVALADKKGLSTITRALNNLQVWNKNKDPKLSKWAGEMIDKVTKRLENQKNESYGNIHSYDYTEKETFANNIADWVFEGDVDFNLLELEDIIGPLDMEDYESPEALADKLQTFDLDTLTYIDSELNINEFNESLINEYSNDLVSYVCPIFNYSDYKIMDNYIKQIADDINVSSTVIHTDLDTKFPSGKRVYRNTKLNHPEWFQGVSPVAVIEFWANGYNNDEAEKIIRKALSLKPTTARTESLKEDSTGGVDTKLEDIDYIMYKCLDEYDVEIVSDNTFGEYEVSYQDTVKATVKFDLSPDTTAYYIYYINGKGPYEDNSDERVCMNIQQYLKDILYDLDESKCLTEASLPDWQDTIMEEIKNVLNNKHIYADVYEYADFSGNNDAFVVCVNINDGDWKHEHRRADLIVTDLVNHYDNMEITKLGEEVTSEDDGDSYSAIHKFHIIRYPDEPNVDFENDKQLDIQFLNKESLRRNRKRRR